MSQKNQKNLIVVGGVVVALLVGSVLLGGFTKSEPAVNETTANVGACPASGCDSCPAAKTCESEKTCPADCEKPCCAEKPSEGCCGEIKSCCPSEAPAGCCGEPKPSGCCNEGEEPATI